MKSYFQLRELLKEEVKVEELPTHLEVTPHKYKEGAVPGTVISNRKKPHLYGAAGIAGADESIRKNLANPETNDVLKNAQAYTKKATGKEYGTSDAAPKSSLRKQYAIGQTFKLAATDHPEYKKAVFEDYKTNRPDVVRHLKANDYDGLVNRSYQKLAHETSNQFEQLPVKTQYHTGDMSYHNSGEMLRDIHAHNNLTVFRGGDPHPNLGNVDKKTGLSENEMFRAVHDYYGHGVHGNQFGPKGEETAWHAHSKMYTEGAKPAMTAETRGQNSHVNYTTDNLDNMKEMEKHRGARRAALEKGDVSLAKRHETLTRKVGHNWNYAPQASAALPTAMNEKDYDGKVPEHIAHLLHDPAAKESGGVYDVEKDHLRLAELARHHNTTSHSSIVGGGKLDSNNAHSDLKHIASVHGYAKLSANPFKGNE